VRLLDVFDAVAAGGVATGRRLQAAGLTRSSLSSAVRDGQLCRLAPGLFARTQEVDALRLGSCIGALSHGTAAAVIGLDLLDAPRRVEVTVRDLPRNLPALLHVRRARLRSDEVVRRDGLRVTSVERTLVDLARTAPLDNAVVAADSALRSGRASADALAALAHGARGPGSPRVRAMVAASDPRSESALETLLRLVLSRAGLYPDAQAVISDGTGFVARVDFLFRAERLVVEADGYAFHGGRAAYRHDRRRCNALLRAGYRVARFSWEDVRDTPSVVVDLVVDLLGRQGTA
jgi:very-short-patch-repair endonuclease